MKRAHWCVKWQNEKGQNETKWEDRKDKSILLNDCKQKQIATLVNIWSRQHGYQSKNKS